MAKQGSSTKQLKQTLGFWDLMSTAIGQIIGAGIMTLLGSAIALTGRSVPISFLIAAVLVVGYSIPKILICGAVRARGGEYTMVAMLGGTRMAGIYTVVNTLSNLSLAMYSLSFASYFISLFGFGNEKVIALIVTTLFFLINIVGVDIMAGSLIKNPGGGIAPTGGYIAGRKDLVEQCAYRLTTPGIGKEQGATLGVNRELFLGAFNAPHATGEALKTAVFAAALFELLGFDTTPSYSEKRGDIIQLLKLGSNEALVAFCGGIQKGGAVDSFVVPEASDMPGYADKVVMAAGAFTLGSTIELSADAPLREPYAVWMQGGLNFHSARVGVLLAAQSMLDKGLLRL